MNILFANKLLWRHKAIYIMLLGLMLFTTFINYFTVESVDYASFTLVMFYAIIFSDMNQAGFNNFIDVHHILHFPISNLQKIFFLAKNSFVSIKLLMLVPSIILVVIFQSKMLVKVLPVLVLLYALHSLISIFTLFYARRIKKVRFLIAGIPIFVFSFFLPFFQNNTLGIVTKLNSWFLSNYYGICFVIVLLIIFFFVFLLLRFKHIVRNRPFINYQDFRKTYSQ